MRQAVRDELSRRESAERPTRNAPAPPELLRSGAFDLLFQRNREADVCTCTNILSTTVGLLQPGWRGWRDVINQEF